MPILQWTNPRPPDATCPYDYVVAETEFGRFRITWKSWKYHDFRCIDETPWGEGLYNHNAYTTEDAIMVAEDAYRDWLKRAADEYQKLFT